MIKPKASIVHLPVYQPGKPIEDVKRELGLSEVIKLASNENPYGCSENAKQAITGQLQQTHIYPDGAAMELTAAVADFLNVEPNQIIFGAGSDEVILMICRAFLSPGDETIMATHTFPQYKHNAEVEGAVCIEVPLKEGTHDLSAMADKITDRTKVIWLCNPNNPTGTIVTHDEVQQFMARVPEDVMVVLDEAYIEYIETDAYPDSLSLLRQHKNLVLLRTFSKIYGLASLRIGYGVGDPELIRSINQVREPFNTTHYAQAAALAAVKDQAFVKACRDKNSKGLRYFEQQFTRLQIKFYPAFGNFVMVDVKRAANEVFQALLKRGYIVRGGHQLGFPTWLRVTVGNEDHNAGFIRALEAVLEEVKEVESP